MGTCCSANKPKAVRHSDSVHQHKTTPNTAPQVADSSANTRQSTAKGKSRRDSFNETPRNWCANHDQVFYRRGAESQAVTASRLDDIDLSPFMTPTSDLVSGESVRPLITKDLLLIARSSSTLQTEAKFAAKIPVPFIQKSEPTQFLSRSSGSSEGSLQYSLSAFGSNT